MFDGQGNLLIVWNEPHLTGIKILDEQHRGIVSIINALHYLRFSPSEAIVQPTAEMILGYTRIHFQTEMDLLTESGYPLVDEHQAMHEQLLKDFHRIVPDPWALQTEDDPKELLEFLKDWWRNHITVKDMAYGDHVKKYIQSGRKVMHKRIGRG